MGGGGRFFIDWFFKFVKIMIFVKFNFLVPNTFTDESVLVYIKCK